VLTVSDDGPGIGPELLGEIFDRFTRGDSARTRASGGAGLGLSLARAIVEAHGGRIAATSEPGATRFTVTLPR
jgi:two-component system OmpR family sensor kinase